jgi:hypothetical protein
MPISVDGLPYQGEPAKDDSGLLYDPSQEWAMGFTPHEAVSQLASIMELDLYGESGDSYSLFNPLDPDEGETWVQVRKTPSGLFMAEVES